MTPETLKTRVGALEGKRYLAYILDAVHEAPQHQKDAIMSRVMREVVAGRISASEAIEIARAMKR